MICIGKNLFPLCIGAERIKNQLRAYKKDFESDEKEGYSKSSIADTILNPPLDEIRRLDRSILEPMGTDFHLDRFRAIQESPDLIDGLLPAPHPKALSLQILRVQCLLELMADRVAQDRLLQAESLGDQ